jgi:hypothetical protein
MAFAIQSGLSAEPEPNSTLGIEMLVVAAKTEPIVKAKLASRMNILPCLDFTNKP